MAKPKKKAPVKKPKPKPKAARGKKAPVVEAKLQAPIGRPLIEVDVEQLKQLAGIGLSEGEMAAVLKCSIDTLQRRYREEIDTGWLMRNASLRRKQFEMAMGGKHPVMLIFLGKQYLGQKDKLEHSGGVTLEALVCGEKEEE